MRDMRRSTAILAAVLVAALTMPFGPAQASPARLAPLSLDQLLGPAFNQPRLDVDEKIVADRSIPEEFRIRWIAPDRLRTDIYGSNLHIGKVGCVLGNFWVCGPDSAPHMPELQQATMYALFPQHGNNGYCCLHHLQVQAATTPRTYTITATGDPWLFPLGCQGCDLPGSIHRPISSEHYRATLIVDVHDRPLRLDSTVTFDPIVTPHGTASGGKTRVQVVRFRYRGTWTLNVPQGKRLACPSWDRTPGSWCVRARSGALQRTTSELLTYLPGR